MNLKKYIGALISSQNPLRELAKDVLKKFEIGSYETRLELGVLEYPYYGHCMYNGGVLAKKLGYERMSVLEFGVAAGKGLLNIEAHAEKIRKLLSIDINIYGFDTGEGLPEPLDYKDSLHVWKKGHYNMNVKKLKQKLKTAELVLGDIRETSDGFFEEYDPAPIAAIMYDLDFYSSTSAALKMLEADEKYYLPRVFCYFDNVILNEIALCNDYVGERLAINEFNQAHETKKLTTAYYLLSNKVREPWHDKIWIFHNFEHSRYNDFIYREDQQLSLE